MKIAAPLSKITLRVQTRAMTTRHARALRQRLTQPEALFWSRIRHLNAEGVRIRRQAPMGAYIVDFVCHSAKLVIELDGGGHAEPAQIAHDRRRDAWLATRGYDVLRIWNRALYEEHEAVMDQVVETLRDRHRSARSSRD